MSSSKRQQKVVPSVIKSETFIFALAVVSLAIVVPTLLSKSGDSAGGAANAATKVVQDGASAPTITISQIGASPTGAPLTSPSDPSRPAPITLILPYLASFIRVSLGLVARLPVVAWTLINLILVRPLRYPLSIIWALLRPVTLLVEIVYIMTLRTPFRIISWIVAEALYPLYVFLGVSVLLGGTVGLGASQVPKALQLVLVNLRGPPKPVATKSVVPRSAPVAIAPEEMPKEQDQPYISPAPTGRQWRDFSSEENRVAMEAEEMLAQLEREGRL